MLYGLILIWIVGSLLQGWLWYEKGRQFFVGFVISLLLTPIVGMVITIFVKDDEGRLQQREVDQRKVVSRIVDYSYRDYMTKDYTEIYRIDMNSESDLEKVFDLLHDGYVDTETLRLEGNNLSVLVKRENTSDSDGRVTNCLLFKCARPSLILGMLVFHNVAGYSIVDDQGIEIYSVNWYSLKDNTLSIDFNENTKLKVRFEGKIAGYLSDLKHLKEYGGTWILPFWWKIPEKKIQRFDKFYKWHRSKTRGRGDIEPGLREYLKDLYAISLSESVHPKRLKSALERLFVFLSIPENKTSANCHIVDHLVTDLFRDVDLPRRYVEVINAMESLHGAVEEPEFHSSPEKILDMIKKLPDD